MTRVEAVLPLFTGGELSGKIAQAEKAARKLYGEEFAAASRVEASAAEGGRGLAEGSAPGAAPPPAPGEVLFHAIQGVGIVVYDRIVVDGRLTGVIAAAEVDSGGLQGRAR